MEPLSPERKGGRVDHANLGRDDGQPKDPPDRQTVAATKSEQWFSLPADVHEDAAEFAERVSW